MLKIAASILVLGWSAAAAPLTAWETGQLINVSTEKLQTGAPPNQIGPFWTPIEDYTIIRRFVIRTADREITFAQQPSAFTLKDKVPKVILNTAVRFRIDKKKVVFLDDVGEEYKAKLESETPLKP